MSAYLASQGLTFCFKHMLLYAYLRKSMCSYLTVYTILFYALSVFKACWMLSPSLMAIENGHLSTCYRILYYFWRKRGSDFCHLLFYLRNLTKSTGRGDKVESNSMGLDCGWRNTAATLNKPLLNWNPFYELKELFVYETTTWLPGNKLALSQ